MLIFDLLNSVKKGVTNVELSAECKDDFFRKSYLLDKQGEYYFYPTTSAGIEMTERKVIVSGCAAVSFQFVYRLLLDTCETLILVTKQYPIPKLGSLEFDKKKRK